MSMLEIVLLTTMTTLLIRAKEFFAKLKQEHDIVLKQVLSKTLIESVALRKEQVELLKADEKDRDLFCRFYNDVIESESEVKRC